MFGRLFIGRFVLDGRTFEVFSKLRVFRKQIAERDAVPAYAVYTDAELAEIAKLERITSKRNKVLSLQFVNCELKKVL